MMDAPVLLLVGMLGLAVGSFLNVCIYRLPRGLSLLSPPSHCPGCETPVRWRDNVPVVGYLWLRGRCRACGTRISPAYPLVELSTALVFLFAYWWFGPSLMFASRVMFACAMIVLFVVDLQHRVLPNVITLPGMVAGLAFSFFQPPGWVDSVIGVVLGGGILFLMAEAYYRVRGEDGLGMGDVKMLAMIGGFLGWQQMLVTLVLSSFLGSAIGVAMVSMKKGDMKYALPFGTFLALAAVVSAVVGGDIFAWYLRFY